MSHKWEETWHFRHLGKRRSLHGRHGDRKSPKASGGSPWRPPLQVASSFKQGKVATYGRHGDLDAASGDLYTNCTWSPLARWRKRWFSWRPLPVTVLRTRVAIATLMLQVVTPLHFAGSPLMVAMATSTQMAHGRHLLNGEKDRFRGDLLI